MTEFRFNKELYSKVALIKAAYNFTDVAYVHLDCDDKYYYVEIVGKNNETIMFEDFVNEMLTQSVRHEVYLQTKNIRELTLARSMASSLIVEDYSDEIDDIEKYKEDEILKDWFDND